MKGGKRVARVKSKRTRLRSGSNSVTQIRYDASFLGCDFLDLYVRDSRFRKAVDTGRYTYVDGRVVLNSPEYIAFVNGFMMLRDDIEDSEHQYCLHYRKEYELDLKIPKDIPGRHHPLYKKPGVSYKTKTELPKWELKKSKLEDAQKISSVNDVCLTNIALVVGGEQDPGENFGVALIRLMTDRSVTNEELAELTGLDPKEIQRIRTGKVNPKLKTVIALCIGLSLDHYNGAYMISLAGYALTNSFEHRVYRFILGFAYRDTVYDCNRMLERLHLDKLTNI